MTLNIPDPLVFEGSRLKVYFEDQVQVNKTTVAIVIMGSPNGFLSLANSLIYMLNDLKRSIPINEFPFVHGKVKLTIERDSKNITGLYGRVAEMEPGHFIWRLTEANIGHLATRVHSLGHLNLELHLDYEMSPDDISVYCVLESEEEAE